MNLGILFSGIAISSGIIFYVVDKWIKIGKTKRARKWERNSPYFLRFLMYVIFTYIAGLDYAFMHSYFGW